MRGAPRPLAVAEQVRREVGRLLTEELKDPRLGFVTIHEVRVSRDLGLATLSYSQLEESEEAKAATRTALRQAAPWLRRELARAMRIRQVPELRFVPDMNFVNSLRIQQVLHEIEDETEAPPPSEEEEGT